MVFKKDVEFNDNDVFQWILATIEGTSMSQARVFLNADYWGAGQQYRIYYFF